MFSEVTWKSSQLLKYMVSQVSCSVPTILFNSEKSEPVLFICEVPVEGDLKLTGVNYRVV